MGDGSLQVDGRWFEVELCQEFVGGEWTVRQAVCAEKKQGQARLEGGDRTGGADSATGDQ